METLQRLHNRGSVSTGYDIDNSVKMEADNSEYLSRVLSTTGNRRTFTISTWRKRTELGDMQTMYSCNVSGQEGTLLRFATENSSYPDAIQIDIGAVGTNSRSYTAASFRDTSAWYHVVLAVDTTQSTATDRFKLYVNGVLITDYASRNNPAQNFDTSNNHADNSNTQHVGAYTTGGQVYGKTSGYTADTYHIDGQALAPTEFGEFDDDTGIWIPKAYTGSYGTNGFFLDFSDAANLGDDASGNANNFTENNITAADQATDTPTNNFCTINALVDNNFSIWALTEGGTRGPNTGENNASVGTFAVSSGKWYWEGVTTSFSGTNYWKWGVIRADVQQGNSADPASDAGSSWYTGDNAFYTQTSTTASSVAYNTGFTGYTAGDIWSISLNCDVSPYTMTFRINNSVPGTSANNTDRSVGTFASSDSVVPFYMLANSSSDNTYHNFGNPFVSALSGGNSDANGYGDFKYAPPSGYYALCTKNLAEYG